MAETRFKTIGKLESLCYVMAFVSFFIPSGYAVPGIVLAVWRVTAISVSALSILLYLSMGKISVRWAVLSLSVVSFYLLSKIVNKSDGPMNIAVLNTVTVCGYIALMEHALSTNPRHFLKLFIIAGLVMCAAHYCTFLAYRDVPGGMRGSDIVRYGEDVDAAGTWFLLKHDNGSVFYFLPVMTALWLYSLIYGRAKRVTFAFTALMLYMYWSQWAVAAMLVMTSLSAACLALYMSARTTYRSVVGYRGAILIGAAICLSIIVVSTGVAADFISNYFRKRAGFNGRGAIWERALNRVSENHLLFGVGFESDETAKRFLHTNHCHNIIIQTLYTGGLLTTAMTSIGMLLYDTPEKNQTLSKGHVLLLVSIVMTFVASSIDFYPYIPMFYFPFIAYPYVSKLYQQVDAA